MDAIIEGMQASLVLISESFALARDHWTIAGTIDVHLCRSGETSFPPNLRQTSTSESQYIELAVHDFVVAGLANHGIYPMRNTRNSICLAIDQHSLQALTSLA